jgi:hypothetical protein
MLHMRRVHQLQRFHKVAMKRPVKNKCSGRYAETEEALFLGRDRHA